MQETGHAETNTQSTQHTQIAEQMLKQLPDHLIKH